jgi:hypothetical protein
MFDRGVQHGLERQNEEDYGRIKEPIEPGKASKSYNYRTGVSVCWSVSRECSKLSNFYHLDAQESYGEPRGTTSDRFQTSFPTFPARRCQPRPRLFQS